MSLRSWRFESSQPHCPGPALTPGFSPLRQDQAAEAELALDARDGDAADRDDEVAEGGELGKMNTPARIATP